MNGSDNGRHFTFRTLVEAAFPGTEVVHEINLIGPDALAVICSTAPILLELGVELKAVEARGEVGSGMVSYRVGVRDDAALTNLLQSLGTIRGVRECTVSSLAGRVAEVADRGAVVVAEPTIARTGAIETQMRSRRPDRFRPNGPGTAK
ncbi:hypothetical protein RAD15_23490 [Bradyrhizobium sp. 14AA]